MSDPNLPQTPGQPPPIAYASPAAAFYSPMRQVADVSGMVRAIAICVWVYIVLSLVALSINAINIPSSTLKPDNPTPIDAMHIAGIAMSGIVSMVYLGAAVVVCIWTHRVMENARTIEPAFNWNSAVAIVAWFVPVWGWFWPFMALSAAWKASEPAATRGNQSRAPGSLVMWWVVWSGTNAAVSVFTIVIMVISFRAVLSPANPPDVATFHLVQYIQTAIGAVSLSAGVFMLRFMRRLAARQQQAVDQGMISHPQGA